MPSNPSTPDSLRAYPAFMRYWCARGAAAFGFQMLSVAVGWQVYEMTQRAFDLGLIGLVQFVPSVLLALPAGHVADQFERRRILIVSQTIVTAAIALLAAGTWLRWFSEAGIFAMLLVIGVAKAFEFPTTQALLPTLVPPALFPRATATATTASQAATIVGPALGGLVYAFGPHVVYALSTVLYLFAAVLFATLRSERPPPRREPATLKTLFAGVHFIRERPVVLGAISLDLFAVLFGGATALLPIFARDILRTGPFGLGLLRLAPAVGALAMGAWLGRHALRRRVGATMFASVAGFGVATIAFALSTSFALSLAALCALGAFDMISMVIRNSLVQLETPDAMRGRVSAVNSIFINTSNQLGEFESGVTAAWFGAVPATVIGGVGTLAVVALWMGWFPDLRRRERLHCDPAVADEQIERAAETA
ncbi:MAG: MFS transporter [Rudaea sp.]|uniref:MFS transporter n=1 Tax=Rudaea sp. TaxID=2136325 RepID=UPI0039E69862